MARIMEKAKSDKMEKLEEEQPFFTPPADIYETKDSFVVIMDIPGVGKDDLNVMVEEDELTVTGGVAADWPRKGNLIHQEYRVGSYKRRFALSGALDRDKVSAKLESGVLTLTLPKSDRLKPKEIKIEVER
jgi:HSP20 family molecular chaperone IbpA